MVYQDFQDALTEITDFETHDAIFLEPEEIENNQNSQVSQQTLSVYWVWYSLYMYCNVFRDCRLLCD